MHQTETNSVVERFREEFPNATHAADMENYAFDDPDRTALMNAEETVLLLDKSIETFGRLSFKNMDSETIHTNSETHKHDGEEYHLQAFAITEEGAQSNAYYYQTQYLESVANVLETDLSDVCGRLQSQWVMWQPAYPAYIEVNGYRIVLPPLIK